MLLKIQVLGCVSFLGDVRKARLMVMLAESLFFRLYWLYWSFTLFFYLFISFQYFFLVSKFPLLQAITGG